MSGQDDYCELCDLPKAHCIHGMPKPVAEPPAAKAPRAPRKAAPRRTTTEKSSPSTVTTRTKPRKWTPPAEFVPHIVAVLEEAEGGLTADDALDRIEDRMAEQLRPGDQERTPQGELRWRTAARKARRELIEEGVVDADQPGVWQLRA